LRLKQEWQKSPALGLGKQTAKTFVWFGEIKKKISEIINDYLYLPFFLLIILCFSARAAAWSSLLQHWTSFLQGSGKS
jgi:hypothetical protein